MAVSTTGTEAELISEYWNNVFLTNLRENLAFYDYGLKNTQGRGQGVMCHWLGLYDTTGASVTGITEGMKKWVYALVKSLLNTWKL